MEAALLDFLGEASAGALVVVVVMLFIKYQKERDTQHKQERGDWKGEAEKREDRAEKMQEETAAVIKEFTHVIRDNFYK